MASDNVESALRMELHAAVERKLANPAMRALTKHATRGDLDFIKLMVEKNYLF